MHVLGRMRSPDGHWIVEAYSHQGASWYRVVYMGGLFADKLVIGAVARVLREHGDVDLADLVEE